METKKFKFLDCNLCLLITLQDSDSILYHWWLGCKNSPYNHMTVYMFTVMSSPIDCLLDYYASIHTIVPYGDYIVCAGM